MARNIGTQRSGSDVPTDSELEMTDLSSKRDVEKGGVEKDRVRVREQEVTLADESRAAETPPLSIPPRRVEETEVPDGGLRAWLIVVGGMFAVISSFGYIYSYGVFQSYYEQVLLKEHSPAAIAWIGSIQSSLGLLPSILAGLLLDKGIVKMPLLISSILVVVGTILIGECTRYWHFLLCQGIVVGVACGMVLGPAIGLLPHWFKRKRGIAMGVVAIGSSIGGTAFPIAIRKLIPQVGFPWTMRIVGLMLLCTLAVPNLTLTTRLPPKDRSTLKRGMFDFASFTKPPFAVYGLTTLFAFLGIYTVLSYIDISAVSVGVSPDISFYLVAIANAGSGLGRLVGGQMTDRYGAINVMAPMTILAGIVTFAWPYAKSERAFIAVAVAYGFVSGTYISGFMLPVYTLGEIGDVGRRVGMFMIIASAGALCGPPISGAINKASGGFEKVGVWAGTVTIVSAILMIIMKLLVLKTLKKRF